MFNNKDYHFSIDSEKNLIVVQRSNNGGILRRYIGTIDFVSPAGFTKEEMVFLTDAIVNAAKNANIVAEAKSELYGIDHEELTKVEKTLLNKINEPKWMFESFKIFAISDNTNSFGLRQFLGVDQFGNAFKACANYLNLPEKNSFVGMNCIYDENNTVIKYDHNKPWELFERIDEKMPPEVLKEVF